MKKGYALITGASKGIGRSMAMLLAQAGYDLLLVARSGTELQLLSNLLKETNDIKVDYLAIDLSASNAVLQVAEWCKTQTTDLSILINNAGYGLWGNFESLKLEDQMNMLNLNINAVVELTYHLLPLLKQQKEAYILNIASTAAYQAVPTLALYSASKSFILSYSRALRYELKNTTVSVSCLSPGPTATGFASRAGLDGIADLADKFNMSADEVARTGIKGMFNQKAEIITGFLNKVSAFGARHFSKALVERVTASIYKH